MPATQFDRDTTARWYAVQHMRTDPGVREVFFLPSNAPEREIRLLEINELIATRHDEALEPMDFGVDVGGGIRTLIVRVGCYA